MSDALAVAVVGVLGVVVGAVLAARFQQVQVIQAERRLAFGRFARLAYEHVRDLKQQVASRLEDDPSPPPVGSTEELAALREEIEILAPGRAAEAATALYEWIVRLDVFDMTRPVPDPDIWRDAVAEYDRRRETFVTQAVSSSGTNKWFGR